MTDSSAPSEVQILPGREAMVGALSVRRSLPTRGRRTVGPWCFVDHMGPAQLNPEISVDVAPHPHIGLQTVTWVFSGQFLHKDSLGSEQLIEPGQLNLMGAGFGVVHAEEDPNHHRGTLHGMQLWIAQPDSTRQGQSSFQHLSEVPQFELGNISGRVLIGDMAGASSSAQVDSPTLGAELTIRPGVTSLSLSRQFEYAVVVAQGSVLINRQVVAPGSLAYLGTDRDELVIEARETSTAMLIGGEPITEKLMMWWNFVARTQEEISQAYRDWTENSERFGPVNSKFPRIQITPPIWFK